jgi:hypothetical protein
MNEAIEAIVSAFELPGRPTAIDVFNHSFLPPKGERAFVKAGN